MEVLIKGKPPTTPKERVLAIEATAKAICQIAGEGPEDAVMMLLTAAAHLYAQHSKKPFPEHIDGLAHALGCATAAADGFFRIRPVNGPDD